MNTVAAVLCSVGIVLLIAGVVLKIRIETGRMILLEHLREDWTFRVGEHLHNNRYRGLSRCCFQFWVLLYYCLKAGVILILCCYYYILVGIYFLVTVCKQSVR